MSRRIRAAFALTAVACLLTAGTYAVGISSHTRAVLLLVGTVCLTASVMLRPTRLWAPALIGASFVIYGGISGLLAVSDAEPGASPRAFAYASLVTGLAAMASVAAAAAVGRYGGRQPRRPDIDDDRLGRAAKVLVVAGCLGIALVILRLAFSSHTGDGPWAEMKTTYQGGGYLLLLANFAITGFAALLSIRLHRRGKRASTIVIVVVPAALFVAATAVTAQRFFAIEFALMILAVLVATGTVRLRSVVILLVAGIAMLGITQAARNEVRETKTFEPGRLLERLAPDQWVHLYGIQAASFTYTWDVASHRDRLSGGPNTFLALVVKPIPRQLYPGKSQGFGEEFTKRLYPDATADNVYFATPLTAETDYNFGFGGVIIVFAIFGIVLASAERLTVRLAPPVLAPLWAAALIWSGLMFIRGDFANAAVFSAGLIVPLTVVGFYGGFRPRSRRHTLVIDALQVPEAFTGVGRQVLGLGRELRDDPCDCRLEVRAVEELLPALRAAYPPGTSFHVPLRSSRPRSLRIVYQQLVTPLLDSRSTVILCTGDQAPVWGRAKVVLVVHDLRRLVLPDTASRLERLYYRTIVTRGIRRAKQIVTVSEFSASEIRRMFGHDIPLTVVYHHEQITGRPGKRLEENRFLLCVGALRQYKGGDTIVDAVATLDEGTRPLLVFVGSDEGAGPDFRDKIARTGMGDTVRLAGWLVDEELDRLYQTCTATVNASAYEGYGLPVAESLSHGAPTIASDIPAFREVAADAAAYFEVGNAESLASVIRDVMTDSQLRADLSSAAGDRSRELALLRPTWRDVTQRAASLLEGHSG